VKNDNWSTINKFVQKYISAHMAVPDRNQTLLIT